ncbi:glycerol-3-phosphate dehydrogenase [Devosia pacifica]|uniref:Glycerol-3-phosphate dehydrogenase n=1 Tax=Devosia pacifica TaxID=1335967 RepID=A0A918S6C6_9HYPH|nr:glycerol-3-phosphate dehydrogenase [Devosia pacifica]GHA26353.1 glycerol-3-phosphate dehydrogenase [Devosia pacifica]
MSENSPIDLFVIGGGVNGTGVARDAAGRGYSVMLAEMNDLASGTSSAATKLVHGGLRYLEHYEFRLVHEALAEREVLWAMAPHIIWPLRFVLPHHKGLRPAFILRTGLALYDHLGGRRLLPATKTLDLRKDVTGEPLKPEFKRGFEYSDCWVDDARLVALNARDAADRGADIRVGTRVVTARRENGQWQITLEKNGEREDITARMLVNAAGPWVDDVIIGAMGKNGAKNVRLVKGSHIVMHKLFEHDRSYIFQNADGRIIFAIPYEHDYTLIGTTDQDFEGDPRSVEISEDETDYLLRAASEYFEKPLTRDGIAWTYSGVRPLFDDGASAAQEATRDYVLKLEGDRATGAVVNVFGGKLTTYRRLAESVLEKIESVLGKRGPAWTAESKLPGGEFAPKAFDAELRRLGKDYPGFNKALLNRMLRQYGTRARQLLGDAQSPEALGEHFGAGLHAREVDFLIETEWARKPDDILWRRTKLGLKLDQAGKDRLDAYMQTKAA